MEENIKIEPYKIVRNQISKHFKKGARVKAVHKTSGVILEGHITDVYKNEGRIKVKGTIGAIETSEIIDFVEFIVILLPLLDTIFNWIKGKLSGLFKNKNKNQING